MIKVKNQCTGEERIIYKVSRTGEEGWFKYYAAGAASRRFLNTNPMLLSCGKFDSEGYELLKLADEWVVVQGGAPRTMKKVAEPEPKPEPKPEPTQSTKERYDELKKKHPDAVLLFHVGDFYESYEADAEMLKSILGLQISSGDDGVWVAKFSVGDLDMNLVKIIRAGHRCAIVDDLKEHFKEPEPKEPKKKPAKEEPITPEPEPQPQITEEEREKMRKELLSKYGNMGAEIFEYASKLTPTATAPTPAPAQAEVNMEEVEKVVNLKCAELFNEFGKMKRDVTIKVVTPSGATNQVHGTVCRDFQKFCNLVQAGKPLYMYGPAGCGKSYTARQIAEALGLDYYETSQAMFAHELKGYGDAAGNYVPTAFYRAFTGGGLFFLDEVDASAPEALVVLNNAIANKCFDFPVIGNVKAHENFRVIAAGNTRMTGATIEYTARQMQDSSFKNRFFFASCTYDRDVMLAITGNDAEIVDFGADLRRAARETGILQLFSYRQAADLATLQDCCGGDDAYLLRGSVIQEKELDDVRNLYEHLQNKNNRWAKAMNKLIGIMRNEEIW